MGDGATSDQTERDYEIVRWCNGLFVGMLERDETEAFNRLCELKLAARSYEGTGGLMGLAKVRLLAPTPAAEGGE